MQLLSTQGPLLWPWDCRTGFQSCTSLCGAECTEVTSEGVACALFELCPRVCDLEAKPWLQHRFTKNPTLLLAPERARAVHCGRPGKRHHPQLTGLCGFYHSSSALEVCSVPCKLPVKRQLQAIYECAFQRPDSQRVVYGVSPVNSCLKCVYFCRETNFLQNSFVVSGWFVHWCAAHT